MVDKYAEEKLHCCGMLQPIGICCRTDRLSRSVGNYQSTLRNVPGKLRPLLDRGGSLKSAYVKEITSTQQY